MPEISRFYGLVVAMFYNDHNPPHFHVRHESKRGIIPKALALALEWAALRRSELLADWELARQQSPLNKIAPLE